MNQTETENTISPDRFELTGSHYYEVLTYYNNLIDYYGDEDAKSETVNTPYNKSTKRQAIDAKLIEELRKVKKWLGDYSKVINS